jgi:hypothetical protein
MDNARLNPRPASHGVFGDGEVRSEGRKRRRMEYGELGTISSARQVGFSRLKPGRAHHGFPAVVVTVGGSEDPGGRVSTTFSNTDEIVS